VSFHVASQIVGKREENMTDGTLKAFLGQRGINRSGEIG